MHHAQEVIIQSMQRTMLTRLLELTAEQAHALDVGDVGTLAQLSESRANLVRTGSAYLPPQCDWSATLASMVVQLMAASQQLQDALRAAMAAIQRDLRDLSKREQFTHYLDNNSATPYKHQIWKG